MNRTSQQWIGLFPAAGFGTRLQADQSKEIIPVLDPLTADPGVVNALAVPGAVRGKRVPVGDLLMRQFAKADITDVLLIRRAEKRDLATHYLKQSAFPELNITDHVINPTTSTTHTIDAVFEHWVGRWVAFGLPDIILNPDNVLVRLRQKLERDNSDVCLALFPVTEPDRYDMVTLDEHRVSAIEIKPTQTQSTLSWAAAVWRPTFSEFLHHQVSLDRQDQELYPGEIFTRAINFDFVITAETFPTGSALDVGTPEALARANHRANHKPNH